MNFFKKEETFDESLLNSENQHKLALLVKSLPEEDLSLSWRSGLNMKIMAAQDAKRKHRRTKKIFAWSSSVSAGFAATVLFGLMMNPTPVSSPSRNLDSVAFASELVKTHQESLVLASVSGMGYPTHETSITEDTSLPFDDLL